MENLLPSENDEPSPKCGQQTGKNSPTYGTTRGNFAKLKRRIQRNTKKYYGHGTAPQYLIRVQCRCHREWFGLGSDVDGAAKLAREIIQHLRLHGWEATRNKYKPAFEAEQSDLTVGAYIDLVGQHGQLHPQTFLGYAARYRRIVGSIRGIKFFGCDKFTGGRRPSKWRLAVDKTLVNAITAPQIPLWRD
jgi:hypothetical protein